MRRDRLTVLHDIVRAIAGDASGLQERRHQEMGVERSQLLGNDIGLDRVVTAQGRIGTADEQRPDSASLRLEPLQRFLQATAYLADHLCGPRSVHAAGVGQDEEQRRFILQGQPQARDVPAGEQQAAVHRL